MVHNSSSPRRESDALIGATALMERSSVLFVHTGVNTFLLASNTPNGVSHLSVDCRNKLLSPCEIDSESSDTLVERLSNP